VFVPKGTYHAFFWVSIDLIIGFLGLILKSLDNQTEIWAGLSSPLIIKLFEMLDDNNDDFVYKTCDVYSQIKQARLKPLFTHKSKKPD
jgi:hypothetical protein